MSYKIPRKDINDEPFMRISPQFNHKYNLMRTDKAYKCELVNIIDLTDSEKLFRVKILDPEERMTFSFRPGQFVMVEVPGFGEVPISISSSSKPRMIDGGAWPRTWLYTAFRSTEKSCDKREYALFKSLRFRHSSNCFDSTNRSSNCMYTSLLFHTIYR